jgi:hypothetical protein
LPCLAKPETLVNPAKYCSWLILQVIERNVTVRVTVMWNHYQYGESMNARFYFDYLDRNFEYDFYQDHVLQRFCYLDSAALVTVVEIIFGYDKIPN